MSSRIHSSWPGSSSMYSSSGPRSQAWRGGSAALHGAQQRHGVAHVVVGLAQEGQVAGQRDLAAQAALDDRRGQQAVAGVGGLFEQVGCGSSWVSFQEWVRAADRAPAHRHGDCRMAARCGRPLAVARPVCGVEGGAAAHPARDAGVVGQRGVGGIDGGLQRGIVGARAAPATAPRDSAGWPSPNTTACSHGRLAAQRGLDPLGRDVAAEGGDQHVLLAARARARSRRRRCGPGRRWATSRARGVGVAEVAAEQAAGDLDLAVGGHAQPRMRQRRGRRCRAGRRRAGSASAPRRLRTGRSPRRPGCPAPARRAISGAPTAAPPTATSFSEAGARWPVCCR